MAERTIRIRLFIRSFKWGTPTCGGGIALWRPGSVGLPCLWEALALAPADGYAQKGEPNAAYSVKLAVVVICEKAELYGLVAGFHGSLPGIWEVSLER